MGTDRNLSIIPKFFVAIPVFAGSFVDLSEFVVCWERVETIQFFLIKFAVVDAFDPDAIKDIGDVPFTALIVSFTMT